MLDQHMIVGIHVTNRATNAHELQKIFTQYGCNIKTRVGLHHVSDDVCSPNGLILLEMWGDRSLCDELVQRVSSLGGIDVQTMIFDHPRE